MWKKKQTQRKKAVVRHSVQSMTIGTTTCSAHQITMAARIAVLLRVPSEQVHSIIVSACSAAQSASPEHPDVRVLRAAWDASVQHMSQKKVDARSSNDVSLFAIPEKDMRVMTALRIVDRVPYETLAAVWRGYTQERIAQEIGRVCHKIYCLSDKKAHGAQSEFVQVLRMADAQISVAQLSQMRSDLTEHASSVWAFYEKLREDGMRIGSDVVSQRRIMPHKHESDETLSQKSVARQSSPSMNRSATTEKEGRHSSTLRTAAVFIGMIILTIVLVFAVLFILAQFSTTTPDVQQKDIQAQNSSAPSSVSRESEKNMPMFLRSPQELVASLRKHVQSVEDDSAQAVVTIDAAFLALQKESVSVQERIEDIAL